MNYEFLPFTSDMIPNAGRLLAARHKRNRAGLPLLPARFEDPGIASKAVEAIWKEKHKSGFAAFVSGSLVAYLIGETATDPWGRSGYVYLPGYAVSEGENVSVLQDLYSLLGDEWVGKGCFNHYIYLSAADVDVIRAMFDLGFGKERIDALLDLRTAALPEVEGPAGMNVRRAGKGDKAHLGSFSHVIMGALAKPPYWHPTMPEDWEVMRESWSELADDDGWTIWLALKEEEALAMIGFRSESEEDTKMLVSPRTFYLSVAATKPPARGRGINSFLSWYGLEEMRKQGYDVCYTNWISPNLLASRFWPRFGFQDAAYRLAKKVSPMITWAKVE